MHCINIFPQDLVLLPNGKLQWDLNNWAMPVLPCFIDLPKLVSINVGITLPVIVLNEDS